MLSLASAVPLLCLGLLARCQGTPPNSTAQDDITALIQHRHQVQHRRATALGGSTVEAESVVDKVPVDGTFNCKAFPAMCAAPFNCHEVSSADVRLWKEHGVAAAGKPDLRVWCAFPHYMDFASRCQAGDLKGSSKLHFERVMAGRYGRHMEELDGSACFINGHCAKAAAAADEMTAEDAVEICDERFGREAWASWGSRATPPQHSLGYSMPEDFAKGFDGAKQTTPFLLASCAMGNYHCDARYCQDNYCKDEYYVRKYGHFLEASGRA